MARYDCVYADGPEFVCDQGHPVDEMQTKDLGGTFASVFIESGRAEFCGCWWGDPPVRPASLTIEVYGACESCPVFVQARTLDICPHGASFSVEVNDDRVVSVTRTSETLAEFLEREPKEPWMKDCYGPMPYTEAAGFCRRKRAERETENK